MNYEIYEITDKEILNHLPVISASPDQLMLSILKEKGAPVNGTFFLMANTLQYDWRQEYCTIDRTYIFSVKRRVG